MLHISSLKFFVLLFLTFRIFRIISSSFVFNLINSERSIRLPRFSSTIFEIRKNFFGRDSFYVTDLLTLCTIFFVFHPGLRIRYWRIFRAPFLPYIYIIYLIGNFAIRGQAYNFVLVVILNLNNFQIHDNLWCRICSINIVLSRIGFLLKTVCFFDIK